MADKTQAILDARQPVAEYLQSIGKLDAFATFTKDEICGLIGAAVKGVDHSMQRQMGAYPDDEIPF